ncbi:hypothetical protein SEVIR_1G190033v4 [Setaria viridis]
MDVIPRPGSFAPKLNNLSKEFEKNCITSGDTHGCRTCFCNGLPVANSAVPPMYYAHLMASRGRVYMESTTPETRGEGYAPSSSGASSSGANSVTVRRIPVVKDNVKRVMFYC